MSIQPELWVDAPRDALTFDEAAFGHIVLPLCKPVLAVCVVFVFLGSGTTC